MTSRRYAADEAPDFTTWDGKPVADTPPHGVMVVCVRDSNPDTDVLILHRAHNGPAYEGDWAWTPPSGARRPSEAVAACAQRELREEIGLELTPEAVEVDRDWAVFLAEVPRASEILLDAEHDRYEWVQLHEAIRRCQPPEVAEGILLAASTIGAG